VDHDENSLETEVLKLTGLKDSINNVIKELKTLYDEPTNHKMSISLCRNPSSKEFSMIKAYL
jgi:preprotein translocase subunit Sss1